MVVALYFFCTMNYRWIYRDRIFNFLICQLIIRTKISFGKVPKFNRKFMKTESKLIPLTNIYMIVHFPGLLQALTSYENNSFSFFNFGIIQWYRRSKVLILPPSNNIGYTEPSASCKADLSLSHIDENTAPTTKLMLWFSRTKCYWILCFYVNNKNVV